MSNILRIVNLSIFIALISVFSYFVIKVRNSQRCKTLPPIHKNKGFLREALNNKNYGIIWEFFPNVGPTPPFWERFVQNEIFWVIL